MYEKQTRFLQAREALLANITITLKQDPRFIAAWLAGSYARGEQQWFSDLDLHIVVAEEYSETLCAQPWAAGATQPRGMRRPQVIALGGYVPAAPRSVIEKRLALLE